MTIELGPAAEEQGSTDGNPEKSVDDLLWELLVGDVKLLADPISGQAIREGDGTASPKDHS